MNTLADMILASPEHHRLLAIPAQPDDSGTITPDAIPVFIADAVAGFFFAGTAREGWEFGRDFPDCTPPASPMFVEMARPSRIVSCVHGVTDASYLPARWGWRFEATTGAKLAEILADGRRADVLQGYYRKYAGRLAASGRVDVPRVERALGDPDRRGAARRLAGPESGYFAAALIVRALEDLRAGAGREGLGCLLHGDLVLGRDGRVVGPVASLDVLLDDAGRPMPPPLIDAHGGGLTAAETAMLMATILPLTLPAFLALSFMNAAGVILRPADPPPGLARRHAVQGLPAPVPCVLMDIDAVAGVDRN